MYEYAPLYRNPLEEQRIAFLASFIATLPTENVVAWHSREWGAEETTSTEDTPQPQLLDDMLSDAILALASADPDKGIDIVTRLAEDRTDSNNRFQAIEYLDCYGEKIPPELRLRLWDQLVRDHVIPIREGAMERINELLGGRDEATLQPDEVFDGFTMRQIQQLRERHNHAVRKLEFHTSWYPKR